MLQNPSQDPLQAIVAASHPASSTTGLKGAVPSPAEPMKVNFSVHHAQSQILQATQRFLCLVCGRRFGKDHVAAIKFIFDNLARKSPRGVKLYAWINPTYNPQGNESFRVMQEFAHSTPFVEKVKLTAPMEVHLNDGTPGKTTAIVKFFSMENPDSLRGGQYDGVVINEAGIAKELAKTWNEVIMAMLLDRMGWCWIMGTPKGKNDFHKFFMRGLPELTASGRPNPWKSFRFPTHANPFINAEELLRIKDETPEDVFKQEFLGEFLDTGGSVFRGLPAMKMRSLDLQLKPQYHNCRIGIDIGKHTDFTVLVALDEKGNVVGFDRFNQQDWDIIKNRILAFCRRYVGIVKIDVAGAGDPIYEWLVQHNIRVEPAKFTNEVKTKWVRNLMLLIEEGAMCIPLTTGADPSRNTNFLYQELETYAFELLPSGRVRYAAPQGFHDDCVTALFLAASMVPLMSVIGDASDFSNMNLHDIPEVGMSRYT